MRRISLEQALVDMQKTDKKGNLLPFRGIAVQCDLDREEGGERFEFTNAVLLSPGNGKLRYHSRNDTRRIRLLPSQEIRTFSPILLTHYNDHEVYL